MSEVNRRDSKGLYKEALAGKIKNFICIDENVPYGVPDNADLILDTEHNDVQICVSKSLEFVEANDKNETTFNR